MTIQHGTLTNSQAGRFSVRQRTYIGGVILLTVVKAPLGLAVRALLGERNLAFHRVPSAAVRGRSLVALVRSMARITSGIATAIRALRGYGPAVVFSTGGYGSFPAVVAAALLRIPAVAEHRPTAGRVAAARAHVRTASRPRRDRFAPL